MAVQSGYKMCFEPECGPENFAEEELVRFGVGSGHLVLKFRHQV